MSTTQLNNFMQIKRLLRQLRAFGLNPNDWRIDRALWDATGFFGLRHREDAEFRMTGDFTRSRGGLVRVRTLRLASI